jgi:hypothetical protein
MNENPCDGFEIAIERRRHGAGDAGASRGLDAHLAGCERCRAYERLAGGSEEALRQRAGDAVTRMDWEGLRRKVTAGRENVVRAATFAAALWAALLAVLWLARSGALPSGFLDPLPRVLPALVVLTIFGVGVHAGWLAWAVARRRGLRRLASTQAVLFARRADIGRWLRTSTASFCLALVLMPAIVVQWSRRRAPFDAHAAFSLLCELLVIGLNLYLFFVHRPRVLREDAELARFDAGGDGVS